MARLASVDINIADTEMFHNLIELLENYFEDLPRELQRKIKDIENDGLNNIDIEYLNKRFSSIDFEKLECSHGNVVYANKLFKKICRYLGQEVITYPEHFYLKYNGEVIVEW